MDTQYYLKSNVQIEPLVNRWHAFPFLIAPATTAMFTENAHLSIMKSYIQMPFAHAAALKDPDMIGGPFIDYGGKRVDEIKDLMKITREKTKEISSLAVSIKELNKLLRNKAKGYPMEALYDEMPGALKGYVELTYNLEQQPYFRFIERLLYKGPYYDTSFQSIALSLINSDDRPFIFSTPRLNCADTIHLPLSFRDERIDRLIALRTTPQSLETIREMFATTEEQEKVLKSLLTTVPPKLADKFTGKGGRVRYFGHACVLFETENLSIITDPLISYKYETDVPRYTYEDLPDQLDYVLLTHSHHDHIVIETLLQLRARIKRIIVPRAGSGILEDPSMKLVLENLGFQHVYELDELESILDKGVEIVGVPFYGEHCDLDIRSKLAYALKFESKSFIMAADSNSQDAEVYRNVHQMIGDIDVLFIGLECTGAPMTWAYGAFFGEGLDKKIDTVRRTNGSNCRTALEMVRIFSCQEVYLYAMGAEPWLNYIMALQNGHSDATRTETRMLLQSCQEEGIQAESLFARKQMYFGV